jgi:hypothetical protein
MSEMFAFHATLISNTLGTSILVFTRTGFMALLLSHYRPVGTIFAFTNECVSFPLRMVFFNFHSTLNCIVLVHRKQYAANHAVSTRPRT